MSTDPINICIRCAKHPALKRYIRENSDNIGQCNICKNEGIPCIALNESSRGKQVIRGLIRWYWSEWEYNPHIGGNDISDFFYKENPILNHVAILDGQPDLGELDPVIQAITWPATEEYKKGVSLFSGYYKDGDKVFPPLEALRNLTANYLAHLERHLLEQNYFLLEDEAIRYFKQYVTKIDSTIHTSDHFYRARLGFKEEITPEGIDWKNWSLNKPTRYKLPYTSIEIGAPPISNATAGRMNRLGVSYLYLSSDIQTAIAEIRPHPGHYVSVGKFESLNNIRVVDFRAIDLYEYLLTDEIIDDEHYLMLTNINEKFGVPVTPEERTYYLVTQFISDVFRKLDYDGIAFKSSVGSGYNLTIFDPSYFRYINEESSVYSIDSLQYTATQSPQLPQPDDDIPF
jgi:hypothetical protein